MLDDFFIRALIAGLGVSLITGPMGCFTIWKRLSFFGDTLAHSALLGVTMALTFELSIPLAVFVISSIIAVMLLSLQKNTRLPGDALLGLLAHSSHQPFIHYIRNTPKFVFSIGLFSAAEIDIANVRRVSAGSMTPSSQIRAEA